MQDYLVNVREVAKRFGPLRKAVGLMREKRFRIVYRKSLAVMAQQRSSPRCSGPIRVVFIAQYIPSWNKLEPVYRALEADSGFEAYIVCVPSGIQNSQLIEPENTENDTYDYYASSGYNAINAHRSHGDWFGLKELKPDFVFHSRPYNNFMPAAYSSSEIAKYAKVCSLLYGMSTWEEVLHTTINDDYFKDVSLFFAQCLSEKQYFESRFSLGIELGIQRAICSGSPLIDNAVRCDSDENAWSCFGARYRIMWTPRWSVDERVGGSHFLELKDSILEYAACHNEVCFVVRPHPLMFSNFIKRGLLSAEEVVDFKNQCSSLENVLLDSQEEYLPTLLAADVLITDISSIIPEYYITGRPMIFCPPENVHYTEELKRMLIGAEIARTGDEVQSALTRLQASKSKTCRSKHESSLDYVLGGSFGKSVTIIKDALNREIGFMSMTN